MFTRSEGHFYGLSVREPYLYFSDDRGFNIPGTVERARFDGTDPLVIATDTNAPVGVATDDASVYWVTTQNGEVHGKSLDGKQGRNLPSTTFLAVACVAVAPDGKRLYFGRDNEVRVQTLGSTTFQTLVTMQVGPTGVLASDKALFWTTRDGMIWTSTLDGSSPRKLTEGELGPGCLALDGDDLYWPNSGDGKIVRWSLSKGTQTVVALGENAPAAVAADAVSIWWTATGEIRRLAK